jgi:hypothetical protein
VVGLWRPSGDVVAICGPKSSPVTARALEADPVLDFREEGGRWVIVERETGRVHGSPMDDDPPDPNADFATRAGLDLIDSQRTAAASAPLMVKWICRIIWAESGRHNVRVALDDLAAGLGAVVDVAAAVAHRTAQVLGLGLVLDPGLAIAAGGSGAARRRTPPASAPRS